MPVAEQERLKSVLIVQYHLNTPDRDTKEFNQASRTVGLRARYSDFYACLDEFEKLPPGVTDEEFNAVKTRCDNIVESRSMDLGAGQSRFRKGMEGAAPEALAKKQNEIDAYRKIEYPPKIFKRCMDYLDGIEVKPENRSQAESRLPDECVNDSSRSKYPLSREQYAAIQAKQNEKRDAILKIGEAGQRAKIASAVSKHRVEVGKLGLPSDWLKADIIVVRQKWRKLEEYVSLVLDNPNVQSVSAARAIGGGYVITVKERGEPAEGFAFRKEEGNELYLYRVFAGGKSVPIESEIDILTVQPLLVRHYVRQ